MVANGPQTLPERNLGALLNETMEVYGRHFWRVVLLVGLIQVPLSFLTLAAGQGVAGLVVTVALNAVGSVLVYGAIVCAVGRHYLVGEVRVGPCYGRVWWRITTLLAVGALFAAFFAIIAAVITKPYGILIVVATAVYLVYWSVTVQAVIVEGVKPLAAILRSTGLIRRSWWRVFRITLVFNVLFLGVYLIGSMPFEFAAVALSPEAAPVAESPASVEETPVAEPPLAVKLVRLLGTTLATIVSLPIVFISGTLLYYDLRVRKEGFNIATLSEEMATSAVWRLT